MKIASTPETYAAWFETYGHDPDERVAVWSHGAYGGIWVLERSYRARYVLDIADGKSAWTAGNRLYYVFPAGFDPNEAWKWRDNEPVDVYCTECARWVERKPRLMIRERLCHICESEARAARLERLVD